MADDKNKTKKDKASSEKEDAVKAAMSDELANVVEKIQDADSILVALSKDPTVDEMAAAIGLTLSLDRMGKHATAIYSGKTPNALQFLEPENTFEANTNSLRDFIIALDKEKADHLRYKVEDDFVKVYITPYRTTISEKDLEFSHGEVNVDMVISLNVQATEDLDAALQEHGRIMHDAVSVNISSGIPGKLGGVEWNNAEASSVSEMVLELLEALEQPVGKDVATALLTGIVAETERFSNEKTNPTTMAASAKLMQDGADQQLIVAHMEEDAEEEASEEESAEDDKGEEVAPGTIEVDHEDGDSSKNDAGAKEDGGAGARAETGVEAGAGTGAEAGVEAGAGTGAEAEVEAGAGTGAEAEARTGTGAGIGTEAAPRFSGELSPEEQLEQMIGGNDTGKKAVGTLMDELKETVKNAKGAEEKSDSADNGSKGGSSKENDSNENGSKGDSSKEGGEDKSSNSDSGILAIEKDEEIEKPKDYGAMMEAALAEANNAPGVNPAIGAAPAVPSAPEMQPVGGVMGQQNVSDMVNQMVNNATQMAPVANPVAMETAAPVAGNVPTVENAPTVGSVPAAGTVEPVASGPMMTNAAINPAVNAAPMAPATPEAQPIPQPMVGGPELPPPPTPPVDFGTMPPVMPSLPPVQPVQADMTVNPASDAAPVAPATPEVQPMTQQLDMQPVEAQPVNVQPLMAQPELQQQASQQALPTTQQPMTQSAMQQPAAQPVQQPVVQPTQQPVVDQQVMQAPAMDGNVQDTSQAFGIPEAPGEVAAPPEPVNPVIVQPVQDPTSVPPVQDPGAFKIPGM